MATERAKQEKKAEVRIAKGKKAKAVDTTGQGALYRGMARIYTAYGKLYMRATLSSARRQGSPPTSPRCGSPAATPPPPRCAN